MPPPTTTLRPTYPLRNRLNATATDGAPGPLAKVLDVGGDIVDFAKELGAVRIADGALKYKGRDLNAYYQDAGFRQQVRGRLKDALQRHEGQPILLIGHSMGSIIAYDALKEVDRDLPALRIDTLITIGAPLGLPHVIHRNGEEFGAPVTPQCVERWLNFADRNDPVAADVFLKGDYDVNAAGVEVVDDLVNNDYPGNPHKSYGYLRAPEVSDAIAEFLR